VIDNWAGKTAGGGVVPSLVHFETHNGWDFIPHALTLLKNEERCLGTHELQRGRVRRRTVVTGGRDGRRGEKKGVVERLLYPPLPFDI
jgi:hypothetical protein